MLLGALVAVYAVPFTTALAYALAGVDLAWSTLLGVVLAIALAAVATRLIGAPAPGEAPPAGQASRTVSQRNWTLVSFAVLLALALVLLRPAHLDGFPALDGGDAGLAVDRARSLASEGMPYGYASQVVLFVIASWLSALGVSYPWALALPLWLAMSAALPLVVAAGTRADPGGGTGVRLAALALAALGMAFIALPVLFYTYADGFWSQLSVLVPLLVTFVGYALADRPLSRLALLAFGLFSVRFTYALNGADLALAVALACGLELVAHDLPDWPRRAVALLAVASAVAAAAGYVEVQGVMWIEGGFVAYPAETWVLGLVLSAMGLVVAAALTSLVALRRLAFFTGAFAFGAGITMLINLLGDQPVAYFFYKYGLMPAVIVGSLSAFALAWLGRALLTERRRMRRLVAIGGSATLVAGLVTLASGALVYREMLMENAGLGHGARLWRSFDGRVAESIGETLATRPDDVFGAMVAPRWPETALINPIFWRPKAGRHMEPNHWQSLVHAGAIVGETATAGAPARAIFWYDLTARGGEYGAGARAVLKALSPYATCDGDAPRLCHVWVSERRQRVVLEHWDALAPDAERRAIQRTIEPREREVCLARVDGHILDGLSVHWQGAELQPLSTMAPNYYLLFGSEGRSAPGRLELRSARRGPPTDDRPGATGVTLDCFRPD